ncbi:MAG TPA: hypothetical protein ENK57_26610 [Polyangiaceae bacterium]|nr:hypothetical protein [Polyangiaceae bacterium]
MSADGYHALSNATASRPGIKAKDVREWIRGHGDIVAVCDLAEHIGVDPNLATACADSLDLRRIAGTLYVTTETAFDLLDALAKQPGDPSTEVLLRELLFDWHLDLSSFLSDLEEFERAEGKTEGTEIATESPPPVVASTWSTVGRRKSMRSRRRRRRR